MRNPKPLIFGLLACCLGLSTILLRQQMGDRVPPPASLTIDPENSQLLSVNWEQAVRPAPTHLEAASEERYTPKPEPMAIPKAEPPAGVELLENRVAATDSIATLPTLEDSATSKDSESTPLEHTNAETTSAAVTGFPVESESLPSESVKPQFHTTVENDSLWKIAKARYGSGAYFKALFAHNQAVLPNPDRIQPGLEVGTPDEEVLRRLYPELCPPKP